MGIEGRLRDLGLTEVLQLLAVGRKSGTLHCEAPLLGRRGGIGFLQGMIVQATMYDTASPAVDTTGVREVVQEVLRWRDGTFRFAPVDVPDATSPLRLAVEPILMDGAQQAEVWSRIEARVPHARVVPAFADIEPQQLPLLRLTPPQWEILTGVDGQRDLIALADAMEKELTDVAELVHDLIVAGLLVLRDAPVAPRRNPTPPVNPAIPPAGDLWIPDPEDAGLDAGYLEEDEDPVFDPVQWGVLTAEGLPRRATPWPPPRVAPPLPEPSLDERVPGDVAAVRNGPVLQRLGDECARRGDLPGAIAQWGRALDATISGDDADRLRERIVLAQRLHDLLQQAASAASADNEGVEATA